MTKEDSKRERVLGAF